MMKTNKKWIYRIAVILAVLSFAVIGGRERVSAATVKQIELKNGVAKKVQLDDGEEKEELYFKLSGKKISKEDDITTYKCKFQITINGNAVVEETWKTDFYLYDSDDWRYYCLKHAVVVTDIDRSDGAKDILYMIDNTVYRMQYRDGEIVVKENISEMLEALKLPDSVVDLYAISNSSYVDMGLGTRQNESIKLEYKNGKWRYVKDKDLGTISQLMTSGDGTADWVICVYEYDLSCVHVALPLILKDNALQLATKTISGDVLEIYRDGSVTKTITVYTTAGGTKKAYTVKKNDAVQILSYKFVKNKLYLRVKNKNGKLGWIGNKQYKYLFVNGMLD
jgi:hypothetical protein